MSLIVFPAGLKIRTISWTLDRPAQINRSEYTGKRVVSANPWHGLWSAKLELAPIVGEDQARALRAFLGALRGGLNTFRLPATEGLQATLPAATVATTATQGANLVTLSGCLLKAGHLFTVNDELKQVVSVSGYDVSFEPPLRVQATSGTAVETGNPTCLVALTGSDASWGVNQGKVYSAALDVEEVF